MLKVLKQIAKRIQQHEFYVSSANKISKKPNDTFIKKATGFTSSQLLNVKKQVIQILKPNQKDLSGFCAMISVAVWDEMNKPKSLIPYSVYYGEEEHVFLYNKEYNWAFDPTADQFGTPTFVSGASENFKRFHKLTSRELEDARQEGVAYLNRSKSPKVNPKKRKTKDDDWWLNGVF